MKQSDVGGVPFDQCTARDLRWVLSGVAPIAGYTNSESVAISRAIAARLLAERCDRGI